MALDYAVEHLRGALITLAGSEGTPPERLQRAWTDNVQLLWIKRCLTEPLNERFRSLWRSYTAPSDDPQSDVLRALDAAETGVAIAELVDLALDTVAAHARGESPPA